MKFCGPGLGRAITRGVALIPLFLMGPWTGLVSASPFAYVTNWSGHTVSVIDTATNTVVATVPVGSSPWGVAVTPTGTRVYVTNRSSHTVSVIDAATNTVVATVPVGTLPIGVAVTPAGTRVYVANYNSNTVSVIDTATNTVVATVPVGSGPWGVTVTPAGTRIYVTNNGTDTVSVIDTATNTVVATVPVGSDPYGVTVTPSGTRAYVTNEISHTVSVIDTATNTVVATVPVGTLPKGVAVTPAGTRVYVANNISHTVSVIDTATNTVVATVPVGGSPYGVAVTPAGTRVYVANYSSHTVSVIDTATNTVVATVVVPVGSNSNPSPIAFGIFIQQAPASCIPPPSGMVAWWPLDEGAGATSLQDLIGGNSGGNNATLFASPLGAAQAPQPVSGTVKGAIHFPKFGNGLSGARVSPQGALPTVGSADFTIDAWVEFQSAPANRLHYIVNRFDTVQNRGYALYVISPGIAGNERLEFKWGDGTTVSTVQTISPITPGWHHMAVTFARSVGGNALDIRLYVDGAQQGQQTGNPPGLGSLANFLFLEIGQQPGTIDEPITIDELEIFNVALAQSDIQAIYNAGPAGKCKPFVDLAITPSSPTTNPFDVTYAVSGCSGQEMFLVLDASAAPNAVPGLVPFPWSYLTDAGWMLLPTPLSQITPWMPSGPADGLYPLFSGSVPTGQYTLYLGCDFVPNGHLDIDANSNVNGVYDILNVTVQ